MSNYNDINVFIDKFQIGFNMIDRAVLSSYEKCTFYIQMFK